MTEQLCPEGQRLYDDWQQWKSEPAHGIWLLLKLENMDDAWDDFRAHVKECEICKVTDD